MDELPIVVEKEDDNKKGNSRGGKLAVTIFMFLLCLTFVEDSIQWFFHNAEHAQHLTDTYNFDYEFSYYFTNFTAFFMFFTPLMLQDESWAFKVGIYLLILIFHYYDISYYPVFKYVTGRDLVRF